MKLKITLIILFFLIAGFYLLPVTKKNFSELYENQDTIKNSLLTFRQLPTKNFTSGNTNWTYFTTEKKDTTLLFLHGMAGSYDIWWQQMEALQAQYQIISISLPAIESLERVGQDLMQILQKEKVDKVIIVGSSMGGYIGQYMVSAYPDRVQKAVFANTFPPNPDIQEKYSSLRKIIPFLPEWLIMYNFRDNVSQVATASENSPLVKAFLLEQYYGKMSKAQFISRMDIVMTQLEISRDSLQKNIPKLIIEADNDPLITPAWQQALKTLYPEAEVFTFHQKGHFPYLNEAQKYTQTIEEFISK